MTDDQAAVEPAVAPDWEPAVAERRAAHKRDQVLLLLVPRLAVLLAGPALARLVYFSVHQPGGSATAGDLVGSLLSMAIALIGAVTTLAIVWILGWIALRRT